MKQHSVFWRGRQCRHSLWKSVSRVLTGEGSCRGGLENEPRMADALGSDSVKKTSQEAEIQVLSDPGLFHSE